MGNEVQSKLNRAHYGEEIDGEVTLDLVEGITLVQRSVAMNNPEPFELKQGILAKRYNQLIARGVDPESARTQVIIESRSSL